MDMEQLKLLLREGEGLTVEFKERFTSRIDEDIVAFANTRGGFLLLGVRDDGTVSGEHLTNDLKAKVNSIARNCKPSISVETLQIGEVVVIEIPEGTEKPYSCSSGYYRRLNGNTQKMGHEEIRVMFRENDPFPFEERTAKGFSFDDVSKAKIRAFTKEAGIRISRIGIPDFLKSLNVEENGTVKNSGILFFAKDVGKYLSQSQTTLLAFKGTEKLHIYDRKDVRDDLLTQFNETITFLEKHLNVRSEIKGLNREDIYELPLDALREAVVNALMHRDYSIRGTQINVEVYDDRVEIINPGGLPEGLQKKSFGTISIRRNQIISDLFFRLHKVERIGMGIKKIKKAMAKAGLKEPAFETDGFFRAVFYRSEVFSLKPYEETTQKTTQKILAILQRNPSASRREIAESLGNITADGVKYHLDKLRSEGMIKRIGPAKGGHWQVKGDDHE